MATVKSALHTSARVAVAILFVICVLLFRPISWALAVLFVLLSIGSCVSSLTVWAPIACFATLVGLHLFIQSDPDPLDELVRRWQRSNQQRR